MRLRQLPGLGELDRATEGERLRSDPDGLARLLRRILAGRSSANAQWLLIIDQFEELFTSVAAAERDAFLGRLLPALDLPSLRVIATVRSDFLDHCIAHPGLRAEMNRDGSQYNLDAPGPAALEAMITGPLRRCRLPPAFAAEIDDALVRRLVEAASGQPGGLALLTLALQDLHKRCLDEAAEGICAERPRRPPAGHRLEYRRVYPYPHRPRRPHR